MMLENQVKYYRFFRFRDDDAFKRQIVETVQKSHRIRNNQSHCRKSSVVKTMLSFFPISWILLSEEKLFHCLILDNFLIVVSKQFNCYVCVFELETSRFLQPQSFKSDFWFWNVFLSQATNISHKYKKPWWKWWFQWYFSCNKTFKKRKSFNSCHSFSSLSLSSSTFFSFSQNECARLFSPRWN